LATGITTEIREFVKMAFAEIGVELAFRGTAENEEGYVVANTGNHEVTLGRVVVKVDPRYYRPTEVDLLVGDPTKANTKLRWTPEYDLKSLVKDMMSGDIKLMKQDQYLKDGGFKTINLFE